MCSRLHSQLRILFWFTAIQIQFKTVFRQTCGDYETIGSQFATFCESATILKQLSIGDCLILDRGQGIENWWIFQPKRISLLREKIFGFHATFLVAREQWEKEIRKNALLGILFRSSVQLNFGSRQQNWKSKKPFCRDTTEMTEAEV